MSFLYEYELGKATDVIVRELLKLKDGDTFIITADTKSDERVVNATAQAAFAVGAKPMVIWTSTPPGVGKMTDAWLPAEAMRGALRHADAWVEFNYQYINYSETMEITMRENKKVKYFILPNLHTDVCVRIFCNVDFKVLRQFQNSLSDMTKQARRVRITSPAGEDIEFQNNPDWPVINETGYADTPGSHNLPGQIAWCPDFETINGVLVFDGSLVPQIGIVGEPARVYLEGGVIKKIEGGREAKEWDAWLRSFGDPQMLRVAHVCYGFHPAAKLSGQIGEDERVWGCTEWGFGAVGSFLLPGTGGIPAPSHTDGVSLNSSVWLDGKQITDRGSVIEPELLAYAKKLGR